jgi:rifampicin phosphotransferase
VISAQACAHRRRGDALPTSLVHALSDELANRGWTDQPLAVRSSASTEDSSRASFAGIYRSCLNVRGVDALVRAVQDVLDSLWTPAAVAYRERFALAEDDAAMAVVVMPLIPAVASGIAFTCDPITGRENQIVIHANWGLGEALVGGQAAGDEYRVEASYVSDNLRLIAQQIGSKSRTTAASACGGTELQETPRDLAGRAVLSTEQALALAAIVRDVAFALDYTTPFFDIEWACDGTRFWIVQARPITARARYTYPALAGQPRIWSRGNSRDVVPDPLTAMDWSVSRPVINRMVMPTYVLSGYETLPAVQRATLRLGRLYFDSSLLQWEAFDAFGVPPPSYNRFLGGHQPEISVSKPTGGELVARAWRSVRFLQRSWRPKSRAKDTLARAQRDAAERLRQKLPDENAEIVEQLQAQLVEMRTRDDLFLLQTSSSAIFVLLDLVEKYCPGEGYAITAALLSGGEASVTAAQSYDLMELARIAANDGAALQWLRSADRVGRDWSVRLAPDGAFRRAFAEFLDRYGHRAVYESYLRNPRWREAPDYLLDSVVSLIGHEPRQVRDRQQRSYNEARQRAARSLPLVYRPLVPWLIKMATTERNVREGARSTLVAHAGVVRRFLLALAERFVRAGQMATVDDVFHLTLLELYAVANGGLPAVAAANRASLRRRQLEGFTAHADPEVVIEHGRAVATRSAPVLDGPEVSGNRNVWQGTVVGSGRARGVAHVARHPTEALGMPSGAILVAPSTDPSWTPIFLKAGALVMETGGYISHGAIVARELGIPAVVNLPGILEQLQTGEQLDVDAMRGIVRRL